jgi:hypothetical protein
LATPVPGLALADLFHGPVVVADVRFHGSNFLAVERKDEADQPVSAGMMGADVEDELFGTHSACHVCASIQGLVFTGGFLGIRRQVNGAVGVALP